MAGRKGSTTGEVRQFGKGILTLSQNGKLVVGRKAQLVAFDSFVCDLCKMPGPWHNGTPVVDEKGRLFFLGETCARKYVVDAGFGKYGEIKLPDELPVSWPPKAADNSEVKKS
jgi:hypothetical protein